MNAEKALGLLGKVEAKVGQLYTHFGNVFEGDKAASEFFRQLGQDVESSRAVVQYQLRLVKREPGSFGNVDINEQELNAIMEYVDTTIASKEKPTLKDAVELAVKIEGMESMSHYRTALLKDMPEISELIQSMGVPDEVHSRRLRDFIMRRKLH